MQAKIHFIKWKKRRRHFVTEGKYYTSRTKEYLALGSILGVVRLCWVEPDFDKK